MDFDKYFFHHNVFGYGESIGDSFRPPGPPAELLLVVCWLRRAPESEVSHTLAVHWWILINCFIIMLFLVTEIRLVRVSEPLGPPAEPPLPVRRLCRVPEISFFLHS